KDNAHYITIGNTLGIIGLALYLKKQNENLYAEVERLRNEQKKIMGQLLELQEKDTNQNKAIQKLSKKVDTVSADHVESLYHQSNWKLRKLRSPNTFSFSEPLGKNKLTKKKTLPLIEDEDEEEEEEEEEDASHNTLSKKEVIESLRRPVAKKNN